MHTFPRPTEPHLSVERRPADGACPECGAELPFRASLRDGFSVSREPAPPFGSYVPLGLEIARGG